MHGTRFADADVSESALKRLEGANGIIKMGHEW
jgi:hypothetical protein